MNILLWFIIIALLVDIVATLSAARYAGKTMNEAAAIEARNLENLEKMHALSEDAHAEYDAAEKFYEEAKELYKEMKISRPYPLTDEQKELVASVVEAEAGGQGYDGMVLVAECIANAVQIDGYSPEKVIDTLGYLSRKKPSENAYKAVTEVFENGYRTTTKPIMYYYSPANMENGVSEWHETQDYAFSYEGHRFFCRKSAS